MNFYITVLLISLGSPMARNAIVEMPHEMTPEQCEAQVVEDMEAIGVSVLRVTCEPIPAPVVIPANDRDPAAVLK